jgi:ATP-dependent RNA helicase DDX51/DBP6
MFTDVLFTESTSAAEPQATESKSKAEKPVTGEFVGKYTTPKGLSEFFIEAETGQKPLMILYMLHHLKFRRVLCFTNSVESTHR